MKEETLFFFLRLAAELTSVASIIFSFFLLLPKAPQYIVVYSTVGHSGSAMWDAASARPDEQCRVLAQDPNQQNPGPLKRSTQTKPLGHRAGPMIH